MKLDSSITETSFQVGWITSECMTFWICKYVKLNLFFHIALVQVAPIIQPDQKNVEGDNRGTYSLTDSEVSRPSSLSGSLWGDVKSHGASMWVKIDSFFHCVYKNLWTIWIETPFILFSSELALWRWVFSFLLFSFNQL